MARPDGSRLAPLAERLRRDHRSGTPWLAARAITGRWRPLPDFVVIGAQKGGTTALFRYLLAHPDIRPPFRKELRILDMDPGASLNRYRAGFPLLVGSGSRTWRTGEATPEYLHQPWVAPALRRLAPSTRLVVVLRDPVARAYSHYWHSRTRGDESLSFVDAIQEEPTRLAGGPRGPGTAAAHRHRRFGYLDRGRYADQLEPYIELFGFDAVHVVWSDHLRASTAAEYSAVCSHIGVGPFTPASFEQHHVRRYEPMPPSLWAELDRHFAPHDDRLAELVGSRPPWRSDAVDGTTSHRRSAPDRPQTAHGAGEAGSETGRR